MKSIISLSFLLISLQVSCHQLPRHSNDQDNQGGKKLLEDLCLSLEGEQGQIPLDYHKIVPSNTDFAFRFYRNIASDAPGSNIFFSPISISTAFALLTLGAKSESQDQIYRGLAFNLSVIEEKDIHKGFCHLIHTLQHPNNKAHVNIGNTLFIEQSLKVLPKFLEDVKTFYEAEGFLTNFRDSSVAKKQINDYVQNKTHGKITRAIDDLDERTVLVLLNHIFFKAYWKNPFDTQLIKKADFFVGANTPVKVNLMYRRGYYNHLYDEDLSSWVVELPYTGNASAFFILPDEGKLEHVEGALAKESLSKWTTSFIYNSVRLYIPKISIAASYDVKNLLQRMGVTAVFTDSADLSGITGEPNLIVSKAVHKTALDVSESGTEAAAVTTMEFMFRSARLKPVTIIRFDRAFLIIISDRQTSSILFLGKIVNPTEN